MGEAIRNKIDGILVQPRDPAGLAASIDIMLNDEGLRQAMGNSARQRAVERFSWDAIAPEARSIYEEIA
jgi:glycosyltransferase involved in cell wall biosynthesis